MAIPYKPIPRKKPLKPFTDDILDRDVVDDGSFLMRHSEHLHALADHIDAGTAHGRPNRYMSDEDFVRLVRAGAFDV